MKRSDGRRYRTPELALFVVYANPKDYPGKHVVRRHWIHEGERRPEPYLFAHATSLDGVRKLLPDGLYNLGRFTDDDPCIVEVWI